MLNDKHTTEEVILTLPVPFKDGNTEDVKASKVPTVHQLFTNCSPQVIDLMIRFGEGEYSVKELQLFTPETPKSKPLFIEKYITPALNMNLIIQTHPDNPKHPKQKYYLTELGKTLQKKLKEDNKDKD